MTIKTIRERITENEDFDVTIELRRICDELEAMSEDATKQNEFAIAEILTEASNVIKDGLVEVNHDGTTTPI